MLLGTLSQANAAKSQAQAQEQASLYNAQLAERNATVARQQAQAEAAQHDRESRLRISQAVAQAGGQGLDLTGTVLDLVVDSTAQAERDRQTILYKGELRAMGYDSEAALDRFGAGNARARGESEYGSTLIGGLAKTATLFAPGYSIGGGLGSSPKAGGGTAP